MANYRINKLQVGGDAYEFAEWYGVCSTAANTQAKTVTISGFTSAQLVEGCRVVVRFTNSQSYNGIPTLNVSSTGAKQIRITSGQSIGKNVWTAGQIVAFVYYNNYWIIEDGGMATVTFWGKTRLVDSVDGDENDLAITPSAVNARLYEHIPASLWNGTPIATTTLFSGNTPSAESWDSTNEGADKTCEITYDDASAGVAFNTCLKPRAVRITYGSGEAFEMFPKGDHQLFIDCNVGNAHIVAEYGICVVAVPSGEEGAYAIKAEVIYAYHDEVTGLIMTYPLMDYYLKDNGYLTKPDLNVWYGVCNSAAGTVTKSVDIAGFTSAQISDGCKVTVRFEYGNTANSPFLNVSSTGARGILVDGSNYAGQYEWRLGEVITFVFSSSSNGWTIENGSHATTTYWGKTKLTDTISNDSTMALTPKAVYDAGFLTLADLPVWDGSVT